MWVLIVLVSAIGPNGQPSNSLLSSVETAEFDSQEACIHAARQVDGGKFGVEAFCVSKG